MPVCAKCHHEFDIGRFCTNCGHPLDAPVDPDAGPDLWRSDTAERLDTAAQRGAHVAERTDTAERPAVPGRHAERPPPVPPPPPPDTSARFPLFADQVTTPERRRPDDSEPSERPWLAWVAGAVALLLVALLGAWLLFGGDESDPNLVAGEPTGTPAGKAPQQQQSNPQKTQKTQKKTTAPRPARPTEVTSQATVTVPATAEPSTDFDGNVVNFQAGNLLDRVPTTCWRMPGDGTGETITIELPRATRLTSVGLINGYAKTDLDDSGNAMDWYAGNRRVLAVQWAFDDGSAITQDLTETRRLQRMEIEPATTSTVELRLLTVTPPGVGPASRDYTAISDLALVGSPA